MPEQKLTNNAFFKYFNFVPSFLPIIFYPILGLGHTSKIYLEPEFFISDSV